MTGNITTLRYLVDEVQVKTLNADQKGYTPLQMAVVWGQPLGLPCQHATIDLCIGPSQSPRGMSMPTVFIYIAIPWPYGTHCVTSRLCYHSNYTWHRASPVDIYHSVSSAFSPLPPVHLIGRSWAGRGTNP